MSTTEWRHVDDESRCWAGRNWCDEHQMWECAENPPGTAHDGVRRFVLSDEVWPFPGQPPHRFVPDKANS